MTRRACLLFFAGLAFFTLGLSLGNALYDFLGYALLLVSVYGALSVLLAQLTCSASFRALDDTLKRGESFRLAFSAYQKSLLPVAPLKVRYCFGHQDGEVTLSSAFFKREETQVTLNARHVGAYKTGITEVVLSDLFGLFTFTKRFKTFDSVLVLPRPFDIDKPKFCAGDEGNAALQRTQEDFSSPEDVRSYLPGDAMKRVHWKLSMRKQTLLVRKYETPAPPDTLILLDCAEPEGDDAPEKNAAKRDALCEIAVAIAQLQMADQSPVRLPLYGERSNEFTSDHAGSLHLLQEMLALQTFRRGEDFARVLMMELKRMRRTGASVIITTRLDAPVVDAIVSIRRMGPSVRLYLVTYTPGAQQYQPFVQRLQHHLVEVCYVTPA